MKNFELIPGKEWYTSLTFWGATGWAVVGVLEAYSMMNPTLGLVAKAVTAALIALGLRRAL